MNVAEAPAASFALAHVNTQWFEVVAADVPLPDSGLNFAPDGTESFVQCAPLGTLKATEYPVTLAEPLFLIVIVPQYSEPS